MYWNDNEAAPANGGLVNKANSVHHDINFVLCNDLGKSNQ